MFKAEILNKNKIREYDNPPIFNKKQRNDFFTTPDIFRTRAFLHIPPKR